MEEKTGIMIVNQGLFQKLEGYWVLISEVNGICQDVSTYLY